MAHGENGLLPSTSPPSPHGRIFLPCHALYSGRHPSSESLKRSPWSLVILSTTGFDLFFWSWNPGLEAHLWENQCLRGTSGEEGALLTNQLLSSGGEDRRHRKGMTRERERPRVGRNIRVSNGDLPGAQEPAPSTPCRIWYFRSWWQAAVFSLEGGGQRLMRSRSSLTALDKTLLK